MTATTSQDFLSPFEAFSGLKNKILISFYSVSPPIFLSLKGENSLKINP